MENKIYMNSFLELLSTFQSLKQIFSNLSNQYDINFLQLCIIVLSGNYQMNVSSLAESLGVSKSAISQSLPKLYLKKYISRILVKENKKIFFIKLTNKGERIKEDVSKLLEKSFQRVKKELGEEDYSILNLLLVKVRQAIKKIMEGEGIKTC